MLFLVLICGMILTSCGSKEPTAEKITGEFYVMGSKSATVSSYYELDLLFTGDDIKLFKTGETFDVPNGGIYHGEMVFTNLKADDLSKRFGHYTTMYFFIGETLLFDPPIKVFNPLSSMSANDLQMRLDVFGGNNISLEELYQLWDWLPEDEREPLLKAQAENSEMRKRQLDVFFKYLNDTGKLVK